MASLAPALLGGPIANDRTGRGVSRYELNAAGALLGLLLAYGCVTSALSGVPVGPLATVTAIMAVETARATLLVATAYLTLRTLVGGRYCEGMRSRFFWLAVGCTVTTLTFPFFGAFKQVLLPARGFPWDATLAHVGRLLLGGTTPWQVTHKVFGSVDGTLFLDRLYSGWVPLIGGLPMLVGMFMQDVQLKVRLIGSWLMAWVLVGTLGAWLFASAGPCYYNDLVGTDRNYAELQQRLSLLARAAAARGHEITTLEFQPLLLKAFHGNIYAPAGGISAMPSMHVALATLCAIAGFTVNRCLGAIGTLYAVLIWIGSIHFGWHYAVDGPVGAAMMLAIWKASGRIVPQAPAPAPAGN
ncbi:MAG TPA: phosphatase PAP2 family protein [Allosphingosinicella sp.]|jgi:hypothetical protein